MDNLNQNFDMLFGRLENFITTKTVVGDAIIMGDVIMLPLVDVSFGVGAGAGETAEDAKKNGGGAGGVGAKITPSAVLVVNKGNVQLVNVKTQDSVSKLIDLAPGVINKISSLFGGKDDECGDEPSESTQI